MSAMLPPHTGPWSCPTEAVVKTGTMSALADRRLLRVERVELLSVKTSRRPWDATTWAATRGRIFLELHSIETHSKGRLVEFNKPFQNVVGIRVG